MTVDTSPTMQLARYASDLSYDDVPSEVRDRLKVHLLDATGAALFGWTLPWTGMIFRLLDRWGGVEESRVWSSERRLPAAHAAFVNSVSTHAFELDDRRVAAYMHPASATWPTALAIADRIGGVGGQAVITAIVAGYEVGLRVGMATSRGAFARGFYSPGLGGAFAATATAASLLGLSPEQTAAAMNLCATQASGLYSPTMIKRFNLGRGTYNGMVAAELAQGGYVGVADALENEIGGFAGAYSDEAAEWQVDDLGSAFQTMLVELKPYVSSRPNHTAIDCILALKAENPSLDTDSVDQIEIRISSANYKFGAGFAVDSVPAALMSVAYCAAVALADDDAFLDQFSEERVRDPRLQSLLGRITVIEESSFDALGLEGRDTTAITCELKDGTRLHVQRPNAKGHPDRPMDQQEVTAKYHRLLQSVVPRSLQDRLKESILNLDALEDASSVSSLMSSVASGQ